MKIEIDVKELATLIDYLKEQREPAYDVQTLAKEIKEKLPQKISAQFNHRT